MKTDHIVVLLDICIAIAFSSIGHSVTPDDVMRSAGWDVDSATSASPKLVTLAVDNRICYEIMYEFPGETMFLRVDPQTSETIQISGQYGRGPNPTSDTASLSAEWAKALLLSLNPYRIVSGTVHYGEPTIRYDPADAQYIVNFPRTDAEGHKFERGAAGFYFDHGTSKVTGLSVPVLLPEPAVTTGTMISEAEATSIALQALNSHKSALFESVPDKMELVYVPESIEIGVEERNDLLGETTTGTAVVYKILRFESRLTDPAYSGPYEIVKAAVYVDIFSGEVAAGYYTRFYTATKEE